MTTVAVTGATGFVGRALVKALVAQGKEVIALVRSTADRACLAELDIRWVEGDITEPDTLPGAFAGADWLIHTAGMLGQAGVPEARYQQVNATGTRLVLCAAEGCQRILHISSPGVLGPISGAPAAETAPLAPSNGYERSKAAAERIALSLAQQGRPIIIARPEFIYGPGDRHVLGLFQAVQRGLFFYVAGGRNTCHPTYIDDAVDGMLRCLEAGSPGEIYHITGPAPVTFRELGETIAAELGARPPWLSLPRPVAWLGALALEAVGRVTGKEPPLSRSGVAFFSEDRRFSWEKARQQLGYVPAFDLAAGVRQTVAWYREQGWL